MNPDPEQQRWLRRLERERAARQEAERLLEERSSALYEANVALQNLTGNLEQQVAARTAELAQALHKAEAATHAKSEFLAMMSHEIRTPMNAILGIAELMAHSQLDEEQQAQVRMLQRSGDALLVLLNHILDFSKIEAGKLELEQRPFELREELMHTLALFRQLAQQNDLQLHFQLSPELPVNVCGDSTRLGQILFNLLANALKFTRQGGVIHVQTQVRPEPNGWLRLHVAVRDTGIGIPAGRLHRLFQAFSQIDSSTTREYGGTGLGLAISARLCAAMQGGIDVESTEGVDSVFRFHVAFRADQTAAPRRAAPPSASAAVRSSWMPKVLVVDDHVVNCTLAQGMLRKLGMEADVALNGLEAVSCASHHPYDLILMDMHMPKMDGLDATRAIRDLPLQPRPYIVAFTANANAYDTDRERCLQVGMDDFIAKPVRMDDLRALLQKLQSLRT
jgi:signal transduction histidine kinase/CheY-like chemotaxis protein